MQFLDWQAIERALFEKEKSTIEQFAKEHPDIVCSFFACVAAPLLGEFAFRFDTPENAAYEAMKHELMILRRKQTTYEQLGSTDAWRHARSSVNLPLQTYPHTSDFFQYASYTKLDFNWREMAKSHAYPQREEGQDNYLEGQTRWMICRVMDRLVADRIFEHLAMTSPFRLGYEFHEEGLTVLRVLNWPAASGNTIYSISDSPLVKGGQNREWHAIGTEEYTHRDMQQDMPEGSASSFVVPPAVLSSPIRISAYPSSLEERPWSKDITLTLDAGETAAYVQIMWPQLQIDLDGLGRIKVYPTVLAVSLKEAAQPDIYTLTLYDQEQQEFGTISAGSSFEQSALLFSERICLLKIASGSGSPQQNKAVTIQMRLHSFQALLSLASRNLWWLDRGEERRKWQENNVEYRDLFLLLEDLGRHVERFIAEAGVIGYDEKRRKLAVILFALGRVAQAIGAYPQATQFYGKSAQKFRSSRDIAAAEKALSIVRDLYIRQGMKERAKHVASMLLDLRASQ